MGQFGNNVQSVINRVCLQGFKMLHRHGISRFDFTQEFRPQKKINEDIILPRPEMNFIRNPIRFRGVIAWNTLTNQKTRAKTLKEFLNAVTQNLMLIK